MGYRLSGEAKLEGPGGNIKNKGNHNHRYRTKQKRGVTEEEEVANAAGHAKASTLCE
ncbi:hypothetical protein SDC9_123467 [bioreactor metagenome]|uniref:Uncharacterized protein n=1 Tax=bioreactor metagenome TaxID=1076179 RepID=A0A645CHS8_9ZZZZ